MVFGRITLCGLCLVLLGLESAWCFSSWFAEEYCDTPLIEGQKIMSHDATFSMQRLVEIHKLLPDGSKRELVSGNIYESGDVLEISLNGKDVGELVFEANFPFLEHGGCDGRRSTISITRVVIPSDFEKNLEIWAGTFI